MYRYTKFQLIWRTSDFGTNFSPKNMTDKTFEKKNIKVVISMQQCTSLQNLSHKLQIMGPNLPPPPKKKINKIK